MRNIRSRYQCGNGRTEKALVNASGEGKSMKEALSELQKTMLNAESSTDAYNAAVDLFGSKAGPALAEFCKMGN